MSRRSMDIEDLGRPKHRQPVHEPRKPIFQLKKLDDQSCEFVLSNTDISVANALRRMMIAEVPTMAIDIVEISENSSVLMDEFLAHRIGLIPLKSEDCSEMNYARDCDCIDGCNKCTAIFDLDVENTTDTQILVTSAHLIPRDADSARFLPAVSFSSKPEQDAFDSIDYLEGEEDPIAQEIKEQYQDIVIVKLGPNQRLKLTAKAKKGIGKEHAKFSPVATAVYAFEPIITLRQQQQHHQMDEQQKQQFVASCPTKVYDYIEEKDAIVVQNPQNCMFCNECVKCAESMGYSDFVSVKQNTNKFLFTVETSGALHPRTIITQAISKLLDKLQEVQAALGDNVEYDY